MGIQAALVLAAGKGTRMHSSRPKVLQTLLGEPMLCHVLAALKEQFADNIWIVAGHRADEVKAAVPNGRFIIQEEQLGTGHALGTALPVLAEAGVSRVLVINGDAPLVNAATIARFLEEASSVPLAFATICLKDPASYGRVVRKDSHLTGIVEAKDYDDALYGPATGEVNAGLYVMDLDLATKILPRVSNNNHSHEYYITDMVGLALEDDILVKGIACEGNESLLGVNSPVELEQVEGIMRRSINQALLAKGVILHNPESVSISPFAQIEAGADITGPCEIKGASVICADAIIKPFCVINNCKIASGVEVRSFCHLDNAVIEEGALVGPYARLRPGAELGKNSHVGNFVELKKARLGEGAKANHLSYLGDAQIGAGTNIGAGTITCNYDGVHKYQTIIGENAFIGSNTAMVAPVRVGNNTLIGAGSVITKDVPDGILAIARGKQKNVGPVRGRS